MSENKVVFHMPLMSLLQIVLIILKLGGVAPVAAWSWWLVLLPMILGMSLIGLALGMVVLAAVIVSVLD